MKSIDLSIRIYKLIYIYIYIPSSTIIDPSSILPTTLKINTFFLQLFMFIGKTMAGIIQYLVIKNKMTVHQNIRINGEK